MVITFIKVVCYNCKAKQLDVLQVKNDHMIQRH